MKIKNGFELKDICGEMVVLNYGVENINFSKVIHLNSTAACVWNAVVGHEFTIDDVVNSLVAEYEVDSNTARVDGESLVSEWMNIGLIE